ncbi:MAG: N-acetylmuramoyl-L-alanine amidase [Saprospiraceae bacterium]
MKISIALATWLALCMPLFYENFNATNDGAREPAGKGTYKLKKVVLDAGHGGKDPGCIGAISREKDNALAIALRLGQYLEQTYPDVKVIYTRDRDVFVELHERPAIANRHNADLFISIHCNAVVNAAHIRGAETYVMGLHTAQHNLEVAKRENSVVLLEENYQQNYGPYDPNSPEAHILGSMWQSAYLEQSILFASFVQKHLKKTGARDDKGVKQAGFFVLKGCAMPAALVEVGFLTNREEEAFIASEAGRDKIALSLFEAFAAYKNQMEGRPNAPIPTPAKLAHQKTSPPPDKPGPAVSSSSGAKPTPAPKPAAQTNTAPALKPAPAAQTSGAPTPSSPASVSKTATPTPPSSAPANPAEALADEGPYRILLISWPNRMDMQSGHFALLTQLEEIKQPDAYYYYTGKYETRKEADAALAELKLLGFLQAKIEPLRPLGQ